jgi:hypothetical protein
LRDVEAAYTTDATEAALYGWFVTSARWEHRTLVVTYRRAQSAVAAEAQRTLPPHARRSWFAIAVVAGLVLMAAFVFSSLWRHPSVEPTPRPTATMQR